MQLTQPHDFVPGGDENAQNLYQETVELVNYMRSSIESFDTSRTIVTGRSYQGERQYLLNL